MAKKEVVLQENKKQTNNYFARGMRTIKDLLASASVEIKSEDELKVEDNYVRTFVVNGYPSSTEIGFLKDLYDSDNDLDIALHIEPADERTALLELTAEITKTQAQLIADQQSGKITNLTKLQDKNAKLLEQRTLMERNLESMFFVEILGSLYTDDVKTLNREMEKLDNKMVGARTKIMPLHLRQDEGYKSVLPYGRSYVTDYYRNINTGALTGFFPFYNAEISHPGGTFLGINMATATPIFLDWYNKQLLDNANGFVFGKSGSGKTYFVSLLTLRSAIIDGVRTVIIDAEGEYTKVTKAVGGVTFKFEPTEKFKLNVFDIYPEEVLDGNDNPTGEFIINIKSKAADILNLIAVMSQGTLTPDMQSGVSEVIVQIYKDKGITENPESIYEKDTVTIFDEETGEYKYDKIRKKMPQMTDFYNGLH